jgi:phosphatidylethanolamine-binding protein
VLWSEALVLNEPVGFGDGNPADLYVHSQAPAPPAESPPYPHRYTNLLWEQPANWVIPSAVSTKLQNGRSGFSVEDFQKGAGLSNPIAANYFNVTG